MKRPLADRICLAALLLLVSCARPAPLQPPAPQVQRETAEPRAHAAHEPVDAGTNGEPWPYDNARVARSDRGMVTSDNSLATKVGRDVLAAGGNAADAAVATAFALAVTYPTAGNLGGGGFAVARVGGSLRALDFRETAPAKASRNMYVGPDGKPQSDSREGIRAVGVPGSVAGLWELHRALGSKKKTWAVLLAPAIALARNGFVVDDAFASAIASEQARLAKHPVSAALFLPSGAPPAKGSLWKNPELAIVLERIVRGPEGFYEGPTAAAMAQQMTEEGGLITLGDLKAYRAKWRTPIEFRYRGYAIASMPPPSSGGITLAMIAHILEGYELTKLGRGSPEALHVTFEAMRRAYAARNARLGDPDFVSNPIDELSSAEWARRQRATIAPGKATPSSEIESLPASGMGPHTTHFGVVDENGDAVALTTTINGWFGSGVTVKGGGFVLNNEMDDFAAMPGAPNGFGLVQGETNAIAPGKRMLSSMSPTLVFAPDGSVSLVAGAAGGPTIITAVFQEISNVIDFGLDVGRAASAPRFHMQHLPDEVVYERRGLPEGTAERLRAMGYALKERAYLADAPLIGRSGSTWIGVAEPRRLGSLAAGP